MATFTIKQNDTSPAIQTQLLDGNGDPVNITGASVTFHMRTAPAGATKIDASATIVTALTGTVNYTWTGTDTDTPGTYEAEFEVIYADSSVETFPNSGYITVTVVDDIA